MKAVRVVGSGVGLVDVDEPGGDGLVAAMASCSICGTDVELVENRAEGFTLGHELAVVVTGTVYAVEPVVYCGTCDQCTQGFTHRCTGEHHFLGIFADGGLAERVLIPPYALVALPPGLAAQDASLVEPAAVAWRGMRQGNLVPGMRSCVVGGGSIGLMVVAALRHEGFEVDLEARHPHQVAAGERLGAGRPHGEYDVVFDAVSTESGLARCAELARPGGRVVVLGVFYGNVPVPGVPLLVKELVWVGAMAYGRDGAIRDTEAAAAMLAANPEVPATLVTHRFALAEADRAFAAAHDRAAGAIKVVIEPG